MNKITSFIILGIAICILGITLVGNRGFSSLMSLDKEIHALKEENKRLKSDIVNLKNKIYAVQHDPITIEKQAREEFGLSKEDEIVYVFPDLEAE